MRRLKLKTGMLLILSAVLFLTGCTSGEKKSQDADTRTKMAQRQKAWKEAETSPLGKYPETVTFVSDYLYCRYNQVADNVGDVTEGEIPLLLQWDERWGYAAYGDGYIGNGGCGPTSLSMVIVGLTGDNTVTPKVVADYAAENGYYVSGAGSSWTLMSEGAKHFGVDGVIMSFSRDEIYRALEEGHPIICSVGAGDFTTEGHFIVLSGIKDDKICVNDPNSSVNSGKLWTYEELAPQIRNLWEFSLSE